MPYQTSSQETDYDLARFLTVLRERWWAVVLTLVILAGLALGASFLFSPRYSATAQLAYSPSDAQLASQALSASSGTPSLTHNIANDALTLKTTAFAQRVSAALAGSVGVSELLGSTHISSDSTLDTIDIKVSGSDAGWVAKVANAAASEFVKQRQEEYTASLAAAQKLVKTLISSMSAEDLSSTYGAALEQRYQDLSVLLSMQIKDYKVLQEAIAPSSPYFPRPLLNLELALIIGLILGCVLAVLLDHFDRTVKDQATLERLTGLPTIGTIPLAGRRWAARSAEGNPAVGFREGNEVLLESMRMLRSNLMVLGFGATKKSLLVSSVAPGEGKSTLAVNLALTMALSGERVLLVDADFRCPSIDRYLEIPNAKGLVNVIMKDDTSWPTAFQPVEVDKYITARMRNARRAVATSNMVSKLICLTTGPALSNPFDFKVLRSEAMAAMLSSLESVSDYVILDGPPMLVASDALALARHVDAVILASRLGQATEPEVLQLKQILERAEIPTLGVVISGAKQPSRNAYHYYRSSRV